MTILGVYIFPSTNVLLLTTAVPQSNLLMCPVSKLNMTPVFLESGLSSFLGQF